MSKRAHVWCHVATAEEDTVTWKWCIRCGALKYGRKTFLHNAHQRRVLIAIGESPEFPTGIGEECPFVDRSADPIPDDISNFINTHPNATMRLDEEVHEHKRWEAVAIYDEGSVGQVKWLHYEAGTSWHTIRTLLGLKVPK